MRLLTSLYLLDLVTPITASNWNSVSRSRLEAIVQKSEVALVAFTAPLTEKSKLLESEWSVAAAQTKQPLVTIDCTVESELCAEHDVNSLPALRLFKGKKEQDRYRGPRKASEIVGYIRRSTRPSLSFLEATNITSFKSVDKHVFIAYLNPTDTESRSSFEKLAARQHDRFSFGIATDAGLASAEKLLVPSIVCYKTSHGAQEVFSGEWFRKDLESFIEASTAPLIGELTRRNEMKYLQAGKSIIYIFADTHSERSEYQSDFEPLAKKYKEYIMFVTVQTDEYAHMALGLGLEGGRFPALALQNPMFGQVFPFDARSEISPEVVEAWVLDIVGGKVAPWIGGDHEGAAKVGVQQSGAKDEL